MRILSIDVGGTFIKSMLVENGVFLPRPKIATPKATQKEFTEALVGLYRAETGIDGIALSFPGEIEEATGHVRNSDATRIIERTPYRAILSELCDGVPVTVVNDAKAGALGELRSGVLQDVDDAMIIVIGTAIGGAVICDRRVRSGKHQFAGEFSFVTFDGHAADPIERIWGGAGGAAKLARCYETKAGLPKDASTPEQVFALAEAGDALARAAITDFCSAMVPILATLQCTIDPEVFAFGGGMSAQPLFLEILREQMEAYRSANPYLLQRLPKIPMVACQYQDNTAGAYHFFMEHYMEQNGLTESIGKEA